MRVLCASDDREMILRVMQHELHDAASYHPLPSFSYSVGGCTLLRDGFIEVGAGGERVLPALAVLGLCEFPFVPAPPEQGDLVFRMSGHNGTSLTNLFSILSARQRLLNRALDNKRGFFVGEQLMNDILDHPPLTVEEFLRRIYGREAEYRGLYFSTVYIAFSGFRGAKQEEAEIHRQLADLMIRAALRQKWSKAFTRNVKNKKYAFRIWLNSIGMIGGEYEAARAALLARLPGRSDRRAMLPKAGG